MLRTRVPASGMTAPDCSSETPQPPDVVCLQKPFRPPDLMRARSKRRSDRPAIGRSISQRRLDSASRIVLLLSSLADPLPLARRKPLPSTAVSRERDRIGGKLPLRRGPGEAANEAFRAPVEFGLAAELRLDAGDHASGSEPARRRLLDRRPAGLHPYDLENACLVFPAHRQPARQRRQGAILRRIGDEFVQRQRHASAPSPAASWTSGPRNAIWSPVE